MDAITDPRMAGERLLAFARENRLVQLAWHAEKDGREVACLLGAAAGITDVTECPASLMPQWMAHALPGLFDGQTKAHAMTFARRWGEAMICPEWKRIDWDTVRSEWMAFVVQQARDAAAYADAPTGEPNASRRRQYLVVVTDQLASNLRDVARQWAAGAAADARASAYAAARDAQADALMAAVERAMEVARG